MTPHRSLSRAAALWLALAAGTAAAQSNETPPSSETPTEAIDLTVQAGRPLRVALDERVRQRRVGQSITGTLVEPVYAYDRVVLPAGTKVLGHIARLDKLPRGARVRAVLGGDFTPLRRAVLEFDELVLDDGRRFPMRTEVTSATERVVIQEREPRRKGLAGRAREEVAGKARRTVAAVQQPGRLRRLKDTLVSRLPWHPQYLRAGTVYTAVLLHPLAFGRAEPVEAAAAGTPVPPESILHARLVTRVHSAETPRGTPIQAVVTQPLFSADHRLLLPEGTVLAGEVTFAKRARGFHRNGQLRFLFESIQPPAQGPEPRRASLYSVQAGKGQRVAVDEEGGLSVTNSSKRFVAPALASLAFGVSMNRRLDYDTDGAGPEVVYGTAESHGLGGFFGLGLVGAGAAQLSRPVSIGLGVLGLARTVFVSVAGKGQEVHFPPHTTIEVQLGPGRSPAK